MRVIALIVSLAVLPAAIILIILASLLSYDRAFKILIAIDQLFAVIIFGAEDITVSSLLYYYKFKRGVQGCCKAVKKMLLDFTYYFVNTIALVFFNQRNHCKKSFENEFGEFESYLEKYR